VSARRFSRSALGARLSELAPALLIALPAVPFVAVATATASWSTLGRDQGIFQYVAWAVQNGDALYRDVRDVNGPVVTIVHYLFLALGAADEHRFRILDLAATGLSFAVAGALLPSMSDTTRSTSLTVRVAWALAAWVALSGQYLVYGFWDTAQRESFLGWFLLVSVAIQATRSASGDPRQSTTKATLAAAGFFSFIPWLGKPTFALFTASQFLAILVEPSPIRDRLRRLLSFLTGGLAGALVPLAFVMQHGDVRAWLRITLVDVPAMYRFIWPRPPWAILSLPGYGALARTAALTTALLLGLIVSRRMPRRALPIALMPTLGLASVLVQAKGFPYHFQPVTLGITFGWLAIVAALSDALPLRTEKRWLVALQRTLVVLGALVFSVRSGYLAFFSPDPPIPPIEARDPSSAGFAERLAAFERIDFFPRGMRDAAAYLAARTEPSARVQLYGMDAYVLFLARRRSATPYIYAYDLNGDAALHGSFEPDGPTPSPSEMERIRAIIGEHVRDLDARVQREKPAAFVFADRSPLMSDEDAVADFSTHCPETSAWLSENYRQTAYFDGFRIWLRDDLAGQ
jgi:hypothetical protein